MVVVRREGGIEFAMEDERPRGLLVFLSRVEPLGIFSFTISIYLNRELFCVINESHIQWEPY